MKFPKFLTRYVPTGHCNDELPFDWQSFWTRVVIVMCKRIYGSRKKGAWALAENVLNMDDSIGFIEQGLASGKPFMVGKIGTGDMETLLRYFAMTAPGSRFAKWLKLFAGEIGPFWLDNWIRAGICVCAGVFPPTDESIFEFCRIFTSYCDGFDAIPSVEPFEKRIYERLCPDAAKIELESIVPFGRARNWYSALAGKKVLVVHPYMETIKSQYAKNVEFHSGQGPLPRFELLQYKPVNSIGGKCADFAKWKDALDFMIADIEKIDFDIALLGCGVYGVPLSVHIKRMGRQAVYTGGATQIIFGIKGKRWDNLGIYNEHWVRPFQCDIPDNMKLIEGGTFL